MVASDLVTGDQVTGDLVTSDLVTGRQPGRRTGPPGLTLPVEQQPVSTLLL